MQRLTPIVALTSLLLPTPAAFAQNWFVDIGLGVSTVDLDIDSAIDGDDLVFSEDAGFSGTIGAGYYFGDSVYAKLSYASYASVTPAIIFAPDVEYSSTRAGIGFEFPSEGRWAFSVEGGVAFWKAEGTESFLFNPGPEESANIDGSDLYFRVGGAFRINENVDVGLYGDFENNEIGDTAGVQVGLRVKF